MNNAILSLNEISKSYGSQTVLDSLSMELLPGSFYALLGRNGSGKSTLMRVLMRNEPFDSGIGISFGIDMSSDSNELNQMVGFVSENTHYSLDPTVQEILELNRNYRISWGVDYVREALKILNLDPKKSFLSLSRGQRMQVAFLTATAFWPKLLLLDEITSVLDSISRDFFIRRLKEYTNLGGTVVMATNIISEVQNFADRIILLEKGRIEISAKVAELSSQFVKIKRPVGIAHEFFGNEFLVEVELGAEGAIIYLAPKNKESVIPDEFKIESAPTASDIFIYFSKQR